MELKPIREAPTNFAATYICPLCKTCYATPDEAAACFATPMENEWAVGEVVRIEKGYGWMDNTPEAKLWLTPEPGYKFHNKHTLAFYFVVVGISREADQNSGGLRLFSDNRWAHRTIIHVYTEAVTNGHHPFKTLPTDKGFGGWTTDSGSHVSPQKVKRSSVPEAVLKRAAWIAATGPHYTDRLL